MKTNIFVPETIKVGFQSRGDTYTKKLAYVIYIDEKGKVRKEASWKSWCDSEIPSVEYKNEPTSGFVLNRKAGGTNYNWNPRQTYVRVYDPRDFEFEITVPNLLYILENTNSTKGKGLEGEFVYAWDGTELVLMPTSAPEWQDISQFSKKMLTSVSLSGKDLVVGGTYRFKDNEEYVYLGRFDYWDRSWGSDGTKWVKKGKRYFFTPTKFFSVEAVQSLTGRIIEVVSDKCTSEYATLFEKLECSPEYSCIDDTKTQYIPYTFEEFDKLLSGGWSRSYFVDALGNGYYIAKGRKGYEVYKGGYWNSCNSVVYGTLEEAFGAFGPCHKDLYLANGKFYRRDNE